MQPSTRGNMVGVIEDTKLLAYGGNQEIRQVFWKQNKDVYRFSSDRKDEKAWQDEEVVVMDGRRSYWE